MNHWLLAVAVGLFSLILTYWLRRYALGRHLMDVPNERSSHTVPTPRGGGVAIVVSYLTALLVLFATGAVATSTAVALGGSGIILAALGFLDDHGHVAARWRLIGHFVAAAWGLVWLGGLPAVEMFGVHLDLGLIGQIGAAFYLVWLLNLYNFMDGIDGIASVEAMCVCLGAVVVYGCSGFSDLITLPLLLTMAVAGFLYWNFPPAKIFMGDAGSGFLGIMLGLLSLQAAWASSQLLWAWLILLGVFIVDATVTLMRRLVRGDRVYEAHRSHAYQYASRHYGAHLPVTLTVGAINIFWLLPIAVCVVRFGVEGVVGLTVAYVPLIALALRFKAGTVEVR